jgi:hypothetical protein
MGTVTTVHLDMRATTGVASGIVQFTPNRRLSSSTNVVLPTTVTVALVAGLADVALIATDDPNYGGSWAYQVTERISNSSAQAFYVLVPTSATPIPYSALTQIDPATFLPVPRAGVIDGGTPSSSSPGTYDGGTP